MSEDLENRIIHRIESLEAEFTRNVEALKHDFKRSLAELAKDIKAEMKLKHLDIDHRIADHERKLSTQEKVAATIASALGLSILYALLKSIGL